jgi:short subunit dehydrogenase-like uncharacterized protein
MRIIVLGGFGYFGTLAVKALRDEGLRPLIASRQAGSDVTVDVESAESLRRALKPGDILLDAVGPFQLRSTALIEAAVAIGCDVVDLADSLDYVRRVHAWKDRIAAAGIHVFTACSSISAISAAMIRLSGFRQPVRLTGLLVPATRHTAVRGTAASLFASVGRPIEVLANGRLMTCRGWSRARSITLSAPLSHRTGYLFETADAITLPKCWPSLRQVEFYVDTNVLGLNALFRLAARWPALRRAIERVQHRALFVARWLGRRQSGLAYEIEDAYGRVTRLSLVSPHTGQIIPIAPAILTVRWLAQGKPMSPGILGVDKLDAGDLVRYLAAHGVRLEIR